MTIDRERLFDRAECLSKTQIQSFFSRLSVHIKKGNQKRIESEDARIQTGRRTMMKIC